MNIIVSPHAIMRWMERIGAANEDAALAILSGPVVQVATRFGAYVVRHGRARIIIDFTEAGAVIKTVLLAHDFHFPAQLLPAASGGVPPTGSLPQFRNRKGERP